MAEYWFFCEDKLILSKQFNPKPPPFNPPSLRFSLLYLLLSSLLLKLKIDLTSQPHESDYY